ncbi:MAG TPA: hypothetical protein VM076_09970 [Gemmatimonadaceae bacterium]|nr:hypothetical protein [Gemmatimonadaceae bacterium]
MPKNKTWIITTSGERSTKDVAKDLKAKGFTVDQVLDEIGAITGAADDAVAAKLRGVDGVSDVSPDGVIDIGPPDSPTTW